MITTYTLVFVYFFKNSWSPERPEPGYFVVMLFCGLLVFNFFSEVISKSPTLILSNPSYVKRISFPLQLLSAVEIGASLFQVLISLLILFPGIFLMTGRIPATALYLPLVFLPLIIFTLGLSLFIASVGVFLRDLGHGVGVILNVLFFLTPIIYSAQRVPEHLQWFLWLNPIACAVLQTRRVCVYGFTPDMVVWTGQMIGSLLLLGLVSAWYTRISKRFADVI